MHPSTPANQLTKNKQYIVTAHLYVPYLYHPSIYPYTLLDTPTYPVRSSKIEDNYLTSQGNRIDYNPTASRLVRICRTKTPGQTLRNSFRWWEIHQTYDQIMTWGKPQSTPSMRLGRAKLTLAAAQHMICCEFLLLRIGVNAETRTPRHMRFLRKRYSPQIVSHA